MKTSTLNKIPSQRALASYSLSFFWVFIFDPVSYFLSDKLFTSCFFSSLRVSFYCDPTFAICFVSLAEFCINAFFKCKFFHFIFSRVWIVLDGRAPVGRNFGFWTSVQHPSSLTWSLHAWRTQATKWQGWGGRGWYRGKAKARQGREREQRGWWGDGSNTVWPTAMIGGGGGGGTVLHPHRPSLPALFAL